MASDLHARLLAEIERREATKQAQQARMESDWGSGVVGRELAYLAALRKIVEIHRDGRSTGSVLEPFCTTCSDDEYLVDYPCPTVAAIAEALEIPTDDVEAM